MSEASLLFSGDGPVARIILNRPQSGNAITAGMARALLEAATRCDADTAIRCVVLTGAGRLFCAGGDISAFGSDVSQMASSLEETDHMRQKMAVQKHICSLRVQCAKLGIVVMTNHMIDVGRNDVAEALTPERGHNCARFCEFVVIDHQNVGHIIHRKWSAEVSSWTAQPPPRLHSPVVSASLAD